jgi:hypothetical protein
MSHLKEFFNKRVLINCLVFAVPMSLLFTWRYTHLRHIGAFSSAYFVAFGIFLAIVYLLLLVVFFTLYWLSKRQQHPDE